MGRFVDSIITYRILHKLVTPFDQTDAYKLGIIDQYGNPLKKDRDLNTSAERDAYTILDRMIFRLKRIINKVPADRRRVSNFANALSLVREHAADTTEYVFLERDYVHAQATAEDLQETTDYLAGKKMLSFRMFSEDGIVNAVGAGFRGQATPNPNPNLAGRDVLLGYGKPVRRTNPTLKAKKIRTEEYKRPARYPDGKPIPEDLPDLYQPASNSSVPKNQRCDNCEYYVVKTEKCTRWNNAVVKPAYWCAKWDKK